MPRRSDLPAHRSTSRAEEELVDDAIAQINRITRKSLIEAVVSVGDLLVEKFFGGDLGLAASNAPNKPAALRRLLDRAEETPLSATAMRRSIRVSVQYRQLPASVRDALSLRQHEALLPVPDAADKKRLAERALSQNLTGRQLGELVRAEVLPARTGRPRMPTIVRTAAGLRRTLGTPDLRAATTAAALRGIDLTELREVAADLRTAREDLERLADAVDRRIAQLANSRRRAASK